MLIRHDSPSKDGRLSTPYCAAFSRREKEGINSEAQGRDLTHAVDLTHFRYDVRRRSPVNRNKRDRRASGFIPPKRESRNIDARVSQKAGEAADEARLVLVGDIDHRGGEFSVDLDPLDRKD